MNEHIEQNEQNDGLDGLYGKIELTKKEKFKNFIYYHKIGIIVGVIIAVVLSILIGQMAGKVEPDVCFMYAGRYYVDPNSYQSIKGLFTDKINTDYNGDGEINIEIINKTIKTYEQNKKDEEESQEHLYTGDMAEALSAFQNEIAAGESVILFLDVLLYEDIRDAERLIPLSQALGYTPEGAMDEYGILLGKTPFANAVPEFKSMLDNTVVCVKRRIITCDKTTYDNNLNAFKKLFEADYPSPKPTVTETATKQP